MALKSNGAQVPERRSNGFQQRDYSERIPERASRKSKKGDLPREERRQEKSSGGVHGGDGLGNDRMVHPDEGLPGHIQWPAALHRRPGVAEELLHVVPDGPLHESRTSRDPQGGFQESGKEARHGKVVHSLQGGRRSPSRHHSRGCRSYFSVGPDTVQRAHASEKEASKSELSRPRGSGTCSRSSGAAGASVFVRRHFRLSGARFSREMSRFSPGFPQPTRRNCSATFRFS